MAFSGGEIAEYHPHPVFLFGGAPLNLLWVNAAAENWVQRSNKVLLGSTLAQIMPGMGALADRLDKNAKDAIAIQGKDLYVKDRAGREWQCDFHIFRCPPAASNNEGGVCIALIIEPQEKDSVDFAPASQAVALLGQMLAHELKNPLAGIGGAAQLLAAGCEDKEDLELTTLIETEVARIGRLADRMEGFGVTGQVRYAPVNIHTVLRKAALLFQSRDDVALEIIEHYDPSLPSIYGHEDSLMQLVVNLMANAHEAAQTSGQGSRIELRTLYRTGVRKRAANGELTALPVEIQIIDDGPGIEPALRERIFQPFVTSKANGQGLGLALVSKIIEDHEALLELKSKPGRTVFSVLFPLNNHIRS